MNGGSGGAEAVIREPHAFELCAIGLPPNATVLATAADGATAVAKLSVGRGKVVVLASPFAVTTNSVLPDGADSSDGYGWWIEHVNEAFPTSQPMLAHANRTIASALREHALFTVGDGLSLTVNMIGSGEYHLTIMNPSQSALPFRIACGFG